MNFTPVTGKSYPGRRLVLFSWPMDFAFVCPTEIAKFGKRYDDFRDRDALVARGQRDQRPRVVRVRAREDGQRGRAERRSGKRRAADAATIHAAAVALEAGETAARQVPLVQV